MMLVKLYIPSSLLVLPLGVSALWPIPHNINIGTSALKLASSFSIDIDKSLPTDVHDSAARTLKHVKTDGLQRLVPDRGASDTDSFTNAGVLRSLSISLHSGAPKTSGIVAETLGAVDGKDEAYELHVPSQGMATLQAKSALGLLRGMTTFSQLWYTMGNTTYLLNAPVDISDKAAYPYRGLMLDTARNFFPVEDIKRTLDSMSWLKMSYFHWHITDSQSFPLDIPTFPALAGRGAYSASEKYSPADIASVVSYGAARGIAILPEIDTPGHTTSISAAYPEHIACVEASPWVDFANEPPAGQLRFASENTTAFVTKMFSSAASLFKGPLFSTGGDELNINCYDKDDETQKILKSTGKTLAQALESFTNATHGALRKSGKTPAVWEEMVLDRNLPLSKDTVVLAWISSKSAKSIAQKGYRLVHAPSDYFYLDCGMGEWIGDTTDATSWCDPFKSWQHAYTFDPLANLSTSEQKLVLGGQQLLWTEQSGPSNLDTQLWPRAAVSAELFWSGPATTNVTEALPRLHDVAFRMERRGTRVTPVQPKWCALRPGKCSINS